MKEVTSVALALFEGLGTSVSLSQYLLTKYGEYDQLVSRTVKPTDYMDADSFRADYIAVSFLKKTAGLPTTFDTRKGAEVSFVESEARCKLTNEFIRQFSSARVLADMPQSHDKMILFGSVTSGAARIIERVLGPIPHPSELNPRFGPGATSANAGAFITIMDKLTSLPECTRDAIWGSRLLNTYPAWSYLLSEVHPECVYKKVDVVDDFGNLVRRRAVIAPRLVRGNRFTTVPKTAKVDRGICIEPHLNSVFQKAVGRIISKKLSRVGLDIPTGQFEQGKLAYHASLTGELATVDLSAASDTISLELVRLLLPPDWFNLLCSLRSPETFFKGEWIELEKFSSMGNGYTFELETLIFWALTKSVVERRGLHAGPSRVRVYGDDIILPTECVPELEVAFQLCGFVVNADKTFDDTSPFRESCGQDFFLGHNVRPFFLKELPNEVHQWFSLANGIRRLGCSDPDGDIWDPRFLRAWLRTVSYIPSRFRRLRGPNTLGDAVINDSREVWLPLTKSRHGISTLSTLYLEPVKRSLDRYCSDTQFAAALYGCMSDGQALRGQIACHRIIKLAVS